MIVRRVRREVLDLALGAINQHYGGNIKFEYPPKPLNKRGDAWRVKLHPVTGNTLRGKRSTPGTRNGPIRAWSNNRGPRHLCACCWHVFRDFIAEVYCWTPGARIETGLRGGWGNGGKARYLNVADFLRRFPATGQSNVGSQAYPQTYEGTCFGQCPEFYRRDRLRLIAESFTDQYIADPENIIQFIQ